jgi:hypothetical protein
MKRSSSIAALDDDIDVKLGNRRASYEESVLVSSMMLVTIEEEGKNRMLRKRGSDGSVSSMSTTNSFSSSSSRGSLRGWGSMASRKSYKVDLCSLGSEEFHGEETVSTSIPMTRERRKFSTPRKGGASSNVPSATNHALDSWGFFLE